VGLVILLLSLSGYYLQYFGGRWEDSVRVVFIASLVMGGMVLLASTTTRDRLKLFISKHFYARKFDYQTEWLRLVNTLMTGRQDNSVYQRSIIGR
ncbi:MAG TPA: PEP-CTERM system histidine kinase PrsK, partial [Gammaproteobacteria bacterium]|nr:PEP-CTERM system histidine kinase PrsK [Gammaproteobacteria bacterium]